MTDLVRDYHRAPWPSRLLKNSAEPPLRSESAVRKAARKRFLAQPEGRHRFEPGTALELPGKALGALHQQLKPRSRPKSCVASARIVFQQPAREL